MALILIVDDRNRWTGSFRNFATRKNCRTRTDRMERAMKTVARRSEPAMIVVAAKKRNPTGRWIGKMKLRARSVNPRTGAMSLGEPPTNCAGLPHATPRTLVMSPE